MTSIQQRLSTGRGKFTTDYPELGTDPVNYEDSISEEFFADERKAVEAKKSDGDKAKAKEEALKPTADALKKLCRDNGISLACDQS